MKTNVGAFDGYFRSLIFIITMLVAIMTVQWLWLIPGVILFATAILMWCPLYAIFGINDNTDPS